MKKMIVISFYKYAGIEEPEKFRLKLLKFCNKLGIRGRILTAQEGINGSVSGTTNQVGRFKHFLLDDKRFSDMNFKEDECLMHPFKKMIVKVKKEIVNFCQEVDLKNTGKHISPEEFIEFCGNKNVIILDARNEYESRVGKFKNAVTLPIKTFREFPDAVKKLEDKKDRKIVMYCTGGIRCEKASAYMKEQGFKEVYQLSGGILNFGKHFPDTIWEGKCFVFDKRLLSRVNNEKKAITNCEICNVECDLYKNCRNKECDEYCIVCLDCERNYGGCCSKECFKEMLSKSSILKVYG